jgi:hypothetical protein
MNFSWSAGSEGVFSWSWSSLSLCVVWLVVVLKLLQL